MYKRYARWTDAAVECYERGCICSGCIYKELTSKKCNMKRTVIELVKELGRPPESNGNMILED